MHHRVATCPRVQGWISRASRSNDGEDCRMSHTIPGQDAGPTLAAVIDCHDREVIGCSSAQVGQRPRRAVKPLAWRFGTLRPRGAPVLQAKTASSFEVDGFETRTCRTIG